MIFFVFCALLVGTAFAGPDWLKTDADKPAVVFFHSRRCGYSKKFLEEVMKDEAFLRVLDNFSVQTVFTDDEPEKQKELAVRGTPGYVFFRPDGIEYWRSGGYAKPMIIRKLFSDILRSGDQVQEMKAEIDGLAAVEKIEKQRELTELLIQRGEWQEALRQIEVLKSGSKPDDYGGLLQMQARAHLRAGNKGLASTLLRLALARENDETRFLETLRVYVNQVLGAENGEQALAEIEGFINRKPDWYGLHRLYAHQAADYGIVNDKAFSFAREALHKSPENARGSAGWALAKLFRKSFDCEGVRKAISEVVLLTDSMAHIRVMANEYEACVDDLKKASEDCQEDSASCSL